MRIDIEAASEAYRSKGLVKLPGMVEEVDAAGLYQRFIHLSSAVRVESDGAGGPRYPGDQGGRCAYSAMEGLGLPPLSIYYRAWLPLVAAVTGQDVVLSPHRRSAISVVSYHPGGDEMEGHFDTNGISLLLYLTTNPEGGETEFHEGDGRILRVKPEAGTVMLFQGRRLWHRSCPVFGSPKVSCAMNYYHAGDTERPVGVDYADIAGRVS